MPVPSTFADLSTTPASNSPAGSESPTDGDNYIRTLAAFIKSIQSNTGNGWTTPYLALAGGTLTGNITATAFVPNGSTVPANGMYLPAANTVAIASNTTLRWSVNSTGNHVIAAPSSGATLSLTALSAGQAITATDGTVTLRQQFGASGAEILTTGAHRLDLGTNGTTRAVIDSAGLVGIGTNAPAARLHVETALDEVVRVVTTGTSPTLTFYNSGTLRSYIRHNPAIGMLLVSEQTGASLQLATENVIRATISSSGAFGIGTSSPGARLHLETSLDEVARVASTGTQPYISLHASGSRRSYIQHSTTNGMLFVSEQVGVPMQFYVDGVARLVIDNTTGDTRPGADNSYDLGTASHRFAEIRGVSMYCNTVKTTAVAVASLPAAGTVGAGTRSFVTDANATTFASIVAGGGANGVPVYSDGTNWRIG